MRQARKRKKTPAPRRVGSVFTADVAQRICVELMDGRSLRSICAADGMPGKATVLRWLGEEHHAEFRASYARAREVQADSLVDEMIDIADDTSNDTIRTGNGDRPNAEWIARSRLRIEARKWVAAKLAPKKYGEKLELSGAGEGGAITVEIVRFSDMPLAS